MLIIFNIMNNIVDTNRPFFGVDMPYREKSAWVYMLAMLVTFGPYFALVAAGHVPMEGMPNFKMMQMYAVACIAQAILLGAGHIYLRLSSSEDDRMPPDERDRALSHRSRNWAYSVLMIGMVWVGCFMPFYSAGWHIVNSTIFMITLAEVVYYVSLVISYRRQA